MPKVTLIIPIHNQKRFKESLESVLKQTYPNMEIIAVSTIPVDNDLKSLLDRHNVICLETENIAYQNIMDTALKVATGDLIAYISESDTIAPQKIELQVMELNENPDVGLVVTAYRVMNENGEAQNNVYITEFEQHDVLFVLLYGYIFNRSTAVFKRECYQKAKEYSDNIETDLDLWIQMTRHCKTGIINRPLAKTNIIPIRRDIQKSISKALDSISLEEIFPDISSQPENLLIRSCAYAMKGAILMKHGLYKDAMNSIIQANLICLETSIPKIWMSMLAFYTGDYVAVSDHLAAISDDDVFYLDARWMLTLAFQAQGASHETLGRINVEVGKQYVIMLQKTLDIIHGKCPELYDLMEDIRLYLNLSIQETVNRLFSGTKMIADEWNCKSPETSDEVLKFYKDTDNYIFELAWWHRAPERKKLTATAIDVCINNSIRTVLDFGCGVGQDGILFSESGFYVTLADLPSKTFDFARWRIQRKSLNINTVNSDELCEKYDAILCFDVLEHVWDPKETVNYLYTHLSDDGILLVTTSFEQRDTHPLHLERNARYSDNEFIKMMENVGFIMEKKYRRPLVFRK